MQSLSFRDCLCDITHPINSNLEAFFPTMKAKYFDAVRNILLTFGTHHFLAGLLEARDMKVMTARSDHQRAIGSADLALFLLTLVSSPLDVVLEYEEGRTFVAAAEVLHAKPGYNCQQTCCYYHHYYFISDVPTTKPVIAFVYLAAASLLYLLQAFSSNCDNPQQLS
jgi:hypothetical protein